MKHLHSRLTRLGTLAVLGGALALGACADYGFGGYGGGYGGYGVYGRYDAYYDGFYGPYYGGYWGPDNVFLYSSRRGGPIVRDEAHHFRHDRGQGFHGVHADHNTSHGDHHPG